MAAEVEEQDPLALGIPDEVETKEISRCGPGGGVQGRRGEKRKASESSIVSVGSSSGYSSTSSSSCSAVDESSELGRFGWAELEPGVYLPTLYRHGDQRSVSVRMAEKTLLQKYQSLPLEVFSCPRVQSRRVSEAEAKLLLEINSRHMNNAHNNAPWIKDLLVDKEELENLVKFLKLAHSKMILKASLTDEKCGFLRISGGEENGTVPYVRISGEKFIPAFFFEGETEQMEEQTVSGWDWAHLRLCCTVQGVKEELIQGDTCQCVALQELSSNFSAGTSFEEYWPAKDFISKAASRTGSQGGSWTRLVSTPGPPYSGSTTQIREFPAQTSTSIQERPYKMIRFKIGEKQIGCVNIKPYKFKELMLTLPLLASELFPGLSDQQVGSGVTGLGVELFRGNSGHRDIVREQRWTEKYTDVPFVKVHDIVSNWKTLTGALNGAGDSGSKRTKGIN